MTHIVPILCLIFFVYFLEFRLKRELHQVEINIDELKQKIQEFENENK